MSRLLNILALVLTFAVLISASPTPYTEDKLFEIDTLRARGVSEVSHALCPFICFLPIIIFPASSFIKYTYESSSQAQIAARISNPESHPQPIPDPVHSAFGAPTNSKSFWSRSMTEILDGLVEKLGVTGNRKDEVVSELTAKGGNVKKRDESEMWVSGKLGQLRVRGSAG